MSYFQWLLLLFKSEISRHIFNLPSYLDFFKSMNMKLFIHIHRLKKTQRRLKICLLSFHTYIQIELKKKSL